MKLDLNSIQAMERPLMRGKTNSEVITEAKQKSQEKDEPEFYLAEIDKNPDSKSVQVLKQTTFDDIWQLSKGEMTELMRVISLTRKSKYLRSKKRKYGNLSRAFTEQQLHQFFDAFQPHEYRTKMFFLTQFFLGLRCGEAVNLKIEDINEATQQTRIQTEKSGTIDFMKIPSAFFPELLEYLRAYEKEIKAANGYIFFSKSRTQKNAEKKNWAQGYLRKCFRKTCERAGFNMIYGQTESRSGQKEKNNNHPLFIHTTHTLRHTYATLAIKGIKDVSLVQRMLRHRKIDSTMVYLHRTQDEIDDAVEKVFSQRMEKQEATETERNI